MKKSILTKLLAFVLAAVMVLGTCVSALAEFSYSKYQEVLYKAAIELYELYKKAQDHIEAESITSMFSGNQGSNYLELVGEEKKTELLQLEDEFYAEYLDSITHEIIPLAVNYDRVAKFPTKNTAVLRTFAARTSTRAGEDDKLELSKTVTDIGNGQFRIELEAYTTGTVSVVTETKPCDIVLVVDMSTSMKDNFSSKGYYEVYTLDKSKTYYIESRYSYDDVKWCDTCSSWTSGCYSGYGHYAGTKYTPKTSANSSGTQFYEYRVAQSRLEALKIAANTFITNVADQQNNNMAIVGFHDYSVALTNGFLDAKTNEAALKAAINGIDNGDLLGATDHDDGLEAAEALFAAQEASEDRQRVVVMLTDGEPEPLGKGYWSYQTVRDALASAYNLKNTYNAALYTISVMPGTNAANPTSNMDKYMSYLSSNYPNARYTGSNTNNNANDIIDAITPGERAETDGASFYLSASDISTLNSIFEQITTQTGGSSVQLGSNTEIRDIVTPYFEVPGEGDVTVQTFDCTGFTDGQPTWTANGTNLENAVEVADNTITVTGFDFNRNFVSDTGRVEGDTTQSGNFYGRKIKITFVTEPKDEFWGGNNVPTNGEASGVYAEGATEATDTFDVPYVNVRLNVPEMTGNNLNIYLMGESEVTVDDLCNASDFVVDPNAEWKTKYVVITPPSYVNSDQSISGTEDTLNVNMHVVVAPSEPALDTSKGTPVTQNVTKTATGNVYVYKPVLTFEDSAEKYHSVHTFPTYFAANNLVGAGVTWKHVDANTGTTTLDTDLDEMDSAKPTVELNYKYSSDDIDSTGKIIEKEYIPVQVTIELDGVSSIKQTVIENGEEKEVDKSLTDFVTFTHICNCTQEELEASKQKDGNTFKCQWTEPSVKGDPAFLIHVYDVDGVIKITKSFVDQAGAAVETDESALFTVKDSNNKVLWTVVITGNSSEYIVGVPVGTYTVTENSDWTIRYSPTGDQQRTVTIVGGETVEKPAAVSFTNTLVDKWLIDEFTKPNVFDAEELEVSNDEAQ